MALYDPMREPSDLKATREDLCPPVPSSTAVQRNSLDFGRLISAIAWLGAAITLLGIATFLSDALGSSLLGWLGADCVFVIVATLYASARNGMAKGRS